MKNNLDDMVITLDQLNALLYSMESASIEAGTDDEAKEMFWSLFYIYVEKFEQFRADLRAVCEHTRVANAVLAVNHVETLKRERDELKAFIIRSGQEVPTEA